MQDNNMTLDLTCRECHTQFNSALALLKHFAFHEKTTSTRSSASASTKRLPDLYPINFKRKIRSNQSLRKESDVEGDSGIEDVNPMKFCEVTMDDPPNAIGKDKKLKKHQCIYCPKRFETKRDLKRHILTHTGERPFKCKFCAMDFTRKFILKKHENKFHIQQQNNRIVLRNNDD